MARLLVPYAKNETKKTGAFIQQILSAQTNVRGKPYIKYLRTQNCKNISPPSRIRITTTMEQKIICGDSLEIMRGFADKQFDLVLTDPPYGLGIDGQKEFISANPKHNRKH